MGTKDSVYRSEEPVTTVTIPTCRNPLYLNDKIKNVSFIFCCMPQLRLRKDKKHPGRFHSTRLRFQGHIIFQNIVLPLSIVNSFLMPSLITAMSDFPQLFIVIRSSLYLRR